MTFFVVAAKRASLTVAGDAPGFPCRYSAATPAVCGVAIDVPLIVFVAFIDVHHADVMLTPGANQSTHVPKFENDARRSELSDAPIVIAWLTRAGEALLAIPDTDPDTVPPVVDTVIPKNQESGVPTTSRIGLSFSDNIELATVNGASFIVRPMGGAPLSGKYGVRMGVLNFDPDEDLQPGTTYEVVLPAGGIADLVGNTLASEWTSTFTTN